MQINKIGLYIILSLPIFTFSPWMYPADFPKTIIFRSILAILLFVGLWQHLNNNPTSLKLRGARIIWALAGLLGIFLLSTVFSVDYYFSLWGSPWRGGGIITFAFYFVFAILAFLTLDKKSWQKAWDFSFIVGILISFIAIFQYFGLFSKIIVQTESRPASTLGNPILLAIYLLLLFFIALSFFIKEKDVVKKIFYGLAILIFTYVIFISGTRAVWGGIFTGLLYFLLFYPTSHTQGSKKPMGQSFLNLSKIIAVLFIISIVLIVAYVNLVPIQPKTLQKNRILQTLENRLSIKSALSDERFLGWKVAMQAIKEKPILGWGPENFAVAFDKYYDPKIISSFWWDKAHNIFLDIGVQAGILGIVAYVLLFIILFYELQKSKKTTENRITITGIQATLIGYLIANFFSFDSFSTYLIFFLLIGYTLHLTQNNVSQNPITTNSKKIILALSFFGLIFFLYQYNLKPFLINTETNKAKNIANQKNCDQALAIIEKSLKQHSFLDPYIRMEYVQISKICSDFYPKNNLTYTKRDFELLQEAVKIQPLYVRYFLALGKFATVLANNEEDLNQKNNLLQQAKDYLQKALELAPKHQEIFIAQAEREISLQNFKEAQNYSEKCVELNSNFADCYFYLSLSNIYQSKNDSAQKNLQIAMQKGLNTNSEKIQNKLLDAYIFAKNYKELIPVYRWLIGVYPNNFQYHASLAFAYRSIGNYTDAKIEAMEVLRLSPESKQNVEAFLKTLP